MATSYTPNAFSSGQVGALRGGFVPNAFGGGGATQSGGTGPMAAHLSVPEADRPYASDIALLRGSEYAGKLPDLDKMWRYSPTSYGQQVGAMLSNPQTAGVLETLRNPPPKPGATRQVTDDEGNLITQTWIDDDRGWSRLRRGGDD